MNGLPVLKEQLAPDKTVDIIASNTQMSLFRIVNNNQFT